MSKLYYRCTYTRSILIHQSFETQVPQSPGLRRDFKIHVKNQGPVVQSLINANPKLNFTPTVFVYVYDRFS